MRRHAVLSSPSQYAPGQSREAVESGRIVKLSAGLAGGSAMGWAQSLLWFCCGQEEDTILREYYPLYRGARNSNKLLASLLE